jgi:hypothetical protein
VKHAGCIQPGKPRLSCQHYILALGLPPLCCALPISIRPHVPCPLCCCWGPPFNWVPTLHLPSPYTPHPVALLLLAASQPSGYTVSSRARQQSPMAPTGMDTCR